MHGRQDISPLVIRLQFGCGSEVYPEYLMQVLWQGGWDPTPEWVAWAGL